MCGSKKPNSEIDADFKLWKEAKLEGVIHHIKYENQTTADNDANDHGHGKNATNKNIQEHVAKVVDRNVVNLTKSEPVENTPSNKTSKNIINPTPNPSHSNSHITNNLHNVSNNTEDEDQDSYEDEEKVTVHDVHDLRKKITIPSKNQSSEVNVYHDLKSTSPDNDLKISNDVITTINPALGISSHNDENLEKDLSIHEHVAKSVDHTIEQPNETAPGERVKDPNIKKEQANDVKLSNDINPTTSSIALSGTNNDVNGNEGTYKNVHEHVAKHSDRNIANGNNTTGETTEDPGFKNDLPNHVRLSSDINPNTVSIGVNDTNNAGNGGKGKTYNEVHEHIAKVADRHIPKPSKIPPVKTIVDDDLNKYDMHHTTEKRNRTHQSEKINGDNTETPSMEIKEYVSKVYERYFADTNNTRFGHTTNSGMNTNKSIIDMNSNRQDRNLDDISTDDDNLESSNSYSNDMISEHINKNNRNSKG